MTAVQLEPAFINRLQVKASIDDTIIWPADATKTIPRRNGADITIKSGLRRPYFTGRIHYHGDRERVRLTIVGGTPRAIRRAAQLFTETHTEYALMEIAFPYPQSAQPLAFPENYWTKPETINNKLLYRIQTPSRNP